MSQAHSWKAERSLPQNGLIKRPHFHPQVGLLMDCSRTRPALFLALFLCFRDREAAGFDLCDELR